MKTCTKCRTEKPLTDFYGDRRRDDGRCSWCKTCMDSAERKRPTTDARTLRNRARNRATQQLIANHRTEYDDLVTAELALVTAEAADLGTAPACDTHPTKRSIPLLRPGARRAGQTVADRVRADVGTCPRCISFHDRGHRCGVCGKDPAASKPEPAKQWRPLDLVMGHRSEALR